MHDIEYPSLDFFLSIVLHMCFYWGIHYASDIICSRLIRTYQLMDIKERFDWNNRINAVVFPLLIAVWASTDYSRKELWRNGIAYVLYDFHVSW